MGHVEIKGTHYVVRTDTQRVEVWKQEEGEFSRLESAAGIPVYEREVGCGGSWRRC